MKTRSHITLTLAAGLLLLLLAVAGCSAPSRSTRMQFTDDAAVDSLGATEDHYKGAPPDEHWGRKLGERYFMEGSLLQMQERYADAIVQYRRALRYMPAEFSVVHFAIARCYFAMGKPDTAITFARVAVERDSDNVDARMQLAELMMANGRLGGAIREYEAVTKLQPGNLSARYSLARLLQWSDPTRAAQHYEYLRREVEESEEILLNLAEIYINLARYNEAISAMRELVATQPGSPDLHAMLADIYVRAHLYPDAVQAMLDASQDVLPASLYEEFVASQLDTIAGNLHAGTDTSYMAYARNAADRLSARLPQSWEVTLRSGLIHYHLGDAEIADSLILRALASDDATADAWLEASIQYVNDGSSDRALEFMLPTAAHHEDDYHVPYLIGYAFLLMNRYDSAEHYLRRSVELEQENSEAWGHLAFIYQQQGKTATSDNAYERALENDPYNPTLLNNYAYALAERGKRLEKALEMVNRALEAEPENESYLDTRGWIYFQMRRYEDALRDIQQAVDVGGAGSEVLTHLGDVQASMGDRPAAREAYERALRLSPGNEELQRKLESVR